MTDMDSSLDKKHTTTRTAIIAQNDLIESVAAALQFISYYHPSDYITHLSAAYNREQSPAAKDAMAQILTNSRMSAIGHRPVCQDTGIVNVFLKIGMNVRFEGFQTNLEDAINAGVRKAYNLPENRLRASVVNDPQFARKNTKDNTPAVIHTQMVAGNTLGITVAAKGGGSENKAKFVMLNPSDSIVHWVLETVPKMGAGWCPPGILGLGIGGTAEKAMLMAKESLMDAINMHELQAKASASKPLSQVEEMRLDLYEKVNALGIGAQGLGGLTTVLDIKINMYPTHAASKPVAMIPNCAATRHAHFVLDGSGPVYLDPPSLDLWPTVNWQPDVAKSKRVDLNTLTKEEVASWKPNQTLLLNGKMLTGRDAAHKRIQDMLARGESLPVDFAGRVIYYVGPVSPVGDEAVGPAGPTTATRMDQFTEMMLEQTGLIAMVGKAERGPEAIAAIQRHQSAYLMAVGGAAYLISKAIRSAKIVGFADLGMEAIYEFDVVDMPVTVAVNSQGASAHSIGPAEWKIKISEITKTRPPVLDSTMPANDRINNRRAQMSHPIHIQYFDTPYGELILGVYDGKLCLCDWRYRKKRAAIDTRIQTALQTTFSEQDDALFKQVRSQLTEYFQHQRKQFDIALLMLGSDFQQRVWKALLAVPFGQTTSYLKLAQCIGNPNAVRAVANANGANALSILIPCHRIIGEDGSLVGYTGGLKAKEALLHLETQYQNV